MEIWVFNGARSNFPSGVFSSLALAEEWIKRHCLTGTVTMYRLDTGAYDWAIEHGLFKPSKPHHGTSDFIGKFAGGDVHHHYEEGIKTA